MNDKYEDMIFRSKSLFVVNFLTWVFMSGASFSDDKHIFQICFLSSWFVGSVIFSYLFIKSEVQESKDKQKTIKVTINYLLALLLGFFGWIAIYPLYLMDKLFNFFDKEIFTYNHKR